MNGFPCTLALVTHPGIGSALVNHAHRFLATTSGHSTSQPLSGLYLIEVDDELSTDQLNTRFFDCTAEFSSHSKVLLLTDLQGATPASLALKHARLNGWPLLTGLNLPMLLKAITYRHADLHELIDKVISGTRQSVDMLLPPADPAGNQAT